MSIAARPTRRAAPPTDVLLRLGVQVETYLGGHANEHWLVSRRGRRMVLRAYDEAPIGDAGYELDVQRRLRALGWPTSLPIDDPVRVNGRTWGLFMWLPGASLDRTPTRADHRRRGKLLAALHADLETLVDLGQRPGCRRAEALVADPELTARLPDFERLFPREGRILRWHHERAQERFARLDLRHRPLIVLHGDFIEGNLLHAGDTLTGIVDFEATHLNHRVSEFALAWRGKHDALINGYHEVRALDDIDRALLAPALWSWVLMGVAEEIRRMTASVIEPHGLDWQVRMLLRRSPLMGRDSVPYPDL